MEVQSCSREIEAGAALEDCRALINQINAGLSVEEPFVDVSSAAELLLYLEFAASALKKSAPHPREREETKIALKGPIRCSRIPT
jgi:hypothetical protein